MAKKPAEDTRQQSLELVPFNEGDVEIRFGFDALNETVWATQQQIAELFERDANTIGEHLQNLFSEGELGREATTRKFRVVRPEGGRAVARDIDHYNLDAILAVGYRVSSKRATAFRQFATRTLKSYIIDGYAINERRLRGDPQALKELAAKVRELRAGERQIYAAVREVFKVSASDYSSSSQICKSFYAKLQDKFHYAVTGMVAASIILDRADGSLPNMGLISMRGPAPTLDDATVGKNYLDRDEIYTLHLLCEQWMLFVETKAFRGQRMTMRQLAEKLDELLALSDYPVFQEYKSYLKDHAVAHARRELAAYQRRMLARPPGEDPNYDEIEVA